LTGVDDLDEPAAPPHHAFHALLHLGRHARHGLLHLLRHVLDHLRELIDIGACEARVRLLGVVEHGDHARAGIEDGARVLVGVLPDLALTDQDRLKRRARPLGDFELDPAVSERRGRGGKNTGESWL
jgi:hypothetical protein